MELSIKPIGETFAAEIIGIECRNPLSSQAILEIESAMDRFAVLVFRNQKIDDKQQLAFTLNFGEIEKNPPEYKEVVCRIRNKEQTRRLADGVGDFANKDDDGKPLSPNTRVYQFKLAERLWHSDSSFLAVPAKYSLLSARSVPSWGGNTEFADMRATYDALDERTKQEIEDLVCHHSQIYSREKVGFCEMSDEERQANQPVRQNLVRCHPVTGRKSLFLSAHAGVIEGWSIPESRMFLRDLIEHATQPRFVYSHAWRLFDFVV